jgi:hypothetical protein
LKILKLFDCKNSTNLYNSGLKRLFVIIGISVIPAIQVQICCQDSIPGKISTDTNKIVKAGIAINDSLIADTAKKDTASLKMKKKSAIEDPVKYSAKDSLIFELDKKKVYLYNEAQVNYQNIELKAAYTEFDMGEKTVYATGLPDSVINKSDLTDSAASKLGKVEFKEGEEDFNAEWLRYNFNTKKGFIYFVTTHPETTTTLIGDSTKRTPKGDINFKGAKYSTCELDHPHYYIGLTKAKSVPGDKLISGPAYLVIGDIPLPLILPFGFFPNTKSYSSGLLLPTFGESPNMGFFINGLGYYFGINDYIDATVTGDMYSKGTWGMDSRLNYKLRYRYAGNLRYTYYSNVSGEKGLKDYRTETNYGIYWTHSQDGKANPNSNFSASVNMSSRNNDKWNSYDQKSYLSNQKSSSVNYSYRWTNCALTTSMNHQQSSITKTIDMELPNMAFNYNTFYPFRKKDFSGEPKWYENIQISYNATLANKIHTLDSLFFTSHTFDNANNGFQHSIPISTNFKINSFINFSPSVNYKGVAYTKSVRYSRVQNGDTLVRVDSSVIHGLQYAHAYYPQFSLGINPKFYGMYQFKNSKIKALRHVMSPSASFSFVPDVRKLNANYYDTVTIRDGRRVKYSYFERGMYGTPMPAQGKSASVGLGLRNNFEMKYLSESDTSSEEKKLSILENLDFSSAYDFLADSCNLAPIRMSAGNRMFDGKLDVRFDASFDPYATDQAGRKIRRFVYNVSKGAGLLRFTNASISMGTNFASSQGNKEKKSKSGNPSQGLRNQNESYVPEEVDYDMPWSISLNYNWGCNVVYKPVPQNDKVTVTTRMNYARFDSARGIFFINENTTRRIEYKRSKAITQSLGFSGELSVTKKWKVSCQSGYDFVSKQITYTSFNFSRDLHCWNMTLSWIPFGFRQSYMFSIYVKTAILRDLKYNKQSDWRERF